LDGIVLYLQQMKRLINKIFFCREVALSRQDFMVGVYSLLHGIKKRFKNFAAKVCRFSTFDLVEVGRYCFVFAANEAFD
jgi:hypothetical protein